MLVALLAPLLAPHDPLEQDLLSAQLPPAWMQGGDPAYWLGTDSLGRCVLSRLIYSARTAVAVALIAATLAALIGIALGLLAGSFGGWVDQFISRLIDVWMAFPPVLLSIVLAAVIGAGLTSVIAAIVVVDWTRFARVVRAETMVQLKRDYAAAARAIGLSRGEAAAAGNPAQPGSADGHAARGRDGDCDPGGSDPVLCRHLGRRRHPDLGRHDRRGTPDRLSGAVDHGAADRLHHR